VTSYAVPALDKALDVLELLAGQSGGLGQAQIAEAVGRSVGEIFRVLQALERRGFILRDRPSGLYLLSTRMLELANQHPPLRGLVQLALGPMQGLALATQQSCNLSVLEGTSVRVVQQVESPADFGFRVRVGAAFPSESTASGAVLLAFAGSDVQNRVRGELTGRGVGEAALTELDQRMALSRRQGHLEQADERQAGILDIVHPVIGSDGHALAVLTVPYVATSYSTSDAPSVRAHAREAAASLSDMLQGRAGR
jgi:DNA-binding IclR family transcriptional regulator